MGSRGTLDRRNRSSLPRGHLTAAVTRVTTRGGWNPMSFNTFGHLFRVTTFGESHGVAIGCVVDGCPPRMPLTEADIQPYLDKRRPGQSRFTTQRREPDQVKILSGVFTDETTGEQVTTGTPIALVVDNVDPRRTIRKSRTSTGPDTLIILTMPSTASATTAAAVVNLRARRPCALRRARSRARSCPV
jgi:hypothetical protein